MWHLVRKSSGECEKFQDALERSADESATITRMEELLEIMPQQQRLHVAECGECRNAAEDYLYTQELFKGVESRAGAGGPSFPAKVMEAIAMRQQEMAKYLSPWSVVPRFASRLAWAAGLVILVGSTWLYQRPTRQLQNPAGGTDGQEYLFEAPQPPLNQDDVLASMAENNP